MFPPSSDPPQLRNRFGYKFPIHLEKPLTYPPLGSSLEHVAAPRIKTQVSMEMTNPVFMVLDFEFKIGRASVSTFLGLVWLCSSSRENSH